MTINRPCLGCGTPSPSTRCPRCTAERNAQRNAQRTQYHGAWGETARAVVKAHRMAVGDWCPGYQVPSHAAHDLTCDHRADGTLGVLCRPCNSRKGALEPVFTRGAPSGAARADTPPAAGPSAPPSAACY